MLIISMTIKTEDAPDRAIWPIVWLYKLDATSAPREVLQIVLSFMGCKGPFSFILFFSR